MDCCYDMFMKKNNNKGYHFCAAVIFFDFKKITRAGYKKPILIFSAWSLSRSTSEDVRIGIKPNVSNIFIKPATLDYKTPMQGIMLNLKDIGASLEVAALQELCKWRRLVEL